MCRCTSCDRIAELLVRRVPLAVLLRVLASVSSIVLKFEASSSLIADSILVGIRISGMCVRLLCHIHAMVGTLLISTLRVATF